MTEHQFAAGGVVIKRIDGKPYVLLIKDSYGHWTWPKGHLEEGETTSEAAIREIQEETALVKVKIIEELGRQEYYFTFEGKRIFKTVSIFLVEAFGDEEPSADKNEIQDAVWISADEAVEKIEYKGSRELLEKGIVIYNEKRR